MNEGDDAARCGKDIDNAKALGADTDASPADLSSGDPAKNRKFAQAIYDACNGGYDPLKNWVNENLKKAGQPPIKNWGDDVKTGDPFVYLLNQLNPDKCNKDALNEGDQNTKSGKVLDSAKAIGAETSGISPSDMSKGNPDANKALAQAIYDALHPKKSGGEGLTDRRVIPGVPIQNLYEECKEALVLLQ